MKHESRSVKLRLDAREKKGNKKFMMGARMLAIKERSKSYENTKGTFLHRILR